MIHLICALRCEAEPLINHYRLTRLENHPEIYLDDNNNFSLTITGIGYNNARIKTGKTYESLENCKSDGWLNIGTAGHQSLPVGTAILAHKINSDMDNNIWYPQFTFTPPCPTRQLTTLAKPSTEYTDVLFDMEAAGFYSALSNYTYSELTHALKIISDNQQYPAGKPDKLFLKKIIKENIETINDVIIKLRELCNELQQINTIPDYYQQCISNWKFTEYERNSLLKLLKRWRLIYPQNNPIENSNRISCSKDMLSYLQSKLDSSPVILKREPE